MRRQGLWVEIGLNLALLTLAVSVLGAGVSWLVTRRVLTDAAAELAEQGAQVISAQLAATPEEDWARTLAAHQRSGQRHLTLVAQTGEVLAGEPIEADRAVRAVFFSRELDRSEADGFIRVVAPVGTLGAPAAVLVVRVPVAAAARPAWTVVAVHALFSAGAIVVFGFVLFRKALVRPLERLGEGARRLADGETGVVVDDAAPAEIQELARTFNTMSSALSGYRQRTAEHLARLEATNRDLQAAQDALVRTEKLASVGRLAAGMAHELGNPLTAVRGYLEVIEAAPGSEEAARRARVEAERMHELLRDLLDFARLEAREVHEVDLAELLGEAVRTVRPQAAFRAIELLAEADADLTLEGEGARLHQVLVNLLLNAADAGARTIRLSARAEGDHAVIRCADDGPGIAPDHLPRLFEPFFTTRPPGKGTGLGLAIAHRVVEQHGGRIVVESRPGAGAVFTLQFPRRGGRPPATV